MICWPQVGIRLMVLQNKISVSVGENSDCFVLSTKYISFVYHLLSVIEAVTCFFYQQSGQEVGQLLRSCCSADLTNHGAASCFRLLDVSPSFISAILGQ